MLIKRILILGLAILISERFNFNPIFFQPVAKHIEAKHILKKLHEFKLIFASIMFPWSKRVRWIEECSPLPLYPDENVVNGVQ